MNRSNGYQPQKTCRTCAIYDDCALALYYGQSYNHCEKYKEVVPNPPTSGSNAQKRSQSNTFNISTRTRITKPGKRMDTLSDRQFILRDDAISIFNRLAELEDMIDNKELVIRADIAKEILNKVGSGLLDVVSSSKSKFDQLELVANLLTVWKQEYGVTEDTVKK